MASRAWAAAASDGGCVTARPKAEVTSRTAAANSGGSVSPPERQSALKEQLRRFNTLPPEQRERALKRMEFMQSLSPEQRKQIKDANQQLQTLPEDRRVMVHKALRHLRSMSPDERQQTLQSDQFKSTFSEQEQNIVKQLAAVEPVQIPTPESK